MMDFSGQQRLLPGMRPRPEIILVDKKNGKETVTSNSNSTFIFLRNCENYELKIEGKAAKIMCENCKSVTIELGRSLVSGTFELLRCRDAFIKLINECEIPVFQIDDSADISIEITQHLQVKSIYFQRTNGIKISLVGMEGREIAIDTSLEAERSNVDEIIQWMSHWNENSSNMITERVKRTGIYPQQEQREAKNE